nr:phosphotransferase [Streptomyces himalayensis]
MRVSRCGDVVVPGVRVLHLDLHPENVLLTQRGPVVIDWANSEEGHPDLDWGMPAPGAGCGEQGAARADGPRGTGRTACRLCGPGCPDGRELRGLHQAVERRAANPTMSRREVELLDEAQTLIRELLTRTGR